MGNKDAAVIAVDGECSGVNEEYCDSGLSSVFEAERMIHLLLASSEISTGRGGVVLCTVEQSVEQKKITNYFIF